MGHLLLGNLPRTRRWQEVVALVESGSSYEDIARATLLATRDHFADACREPGLVEALWLLAQLPICAERRDLSGALDELGITVSNRPDLFEVIIEADSHVQRVVSTSRSATDISEIARLALADTLTGWMAASSHDLFAVASEDARESLRRLGRSETFGRVTREFFSRFLSRHLLYFLSRELSNHVGPNRPFYNIERHSEFNAALELHSRQATRIVQDFSGGWYSKARFEGKLSRRSVIGFLHVALDKIARELLREGPSE